MSKPRLTFLNNSNQPYPAWSMSLLKDAVEINPKTDSLPNQFIYIDLESVQSGTLISTKIYEKQDAPSRAQRLLKAHDVLFQMVRPYQKNNYFFELEGSLPAVSSTGYAQLRATENCPKFIYYTLHTNKFVRSVLDRCTGGAYPAINSSDLGRIVINIPCKEEQQKIAAFFTALDEKIKLVENKLSKTRLLFETLIEKVIDKELTFNDGVCTAVPWKRMELKEVCKKISYGINAPAGEYNGCWKYIRITDIDEKTHKFNQHSPVSANIDHDQKLLTKYKVQTGDVLFARTGASVGKSYHYDPIDGNLVFAGFLIRCSLDLNKCNSYFVYLQTLTKRYSNWVKENSMRSGQPGLNSEQYGNFELVLPSLGEQDKIASFFKIFDKKISNLSFQLDVLKKQKQAFMREMFV